MSFLRKFWAPIGGLVMLAFAMFLAFSLKGAQGPNLSGKFGVDQKPGARVPLDTAFKDENGKDVELRQYFGKRPVLLMLIFYQCRGSCPVQFAGVTTALNAMINQSVGQDFDVVSLSIHPKETPAIALEKKEEVLDQYRRPGAAAGWHFLTGTEEDIRKVTDAVGYRYFYDPAKDQVVHPNCLFVLTPGGKVSKYVFGLDYPAKMLRDSLLDAGQETIAQRSEPILLGCFSLDPVTGKTKLVVMRATQIAGFATVLILATSIFFMSRKPRMGGQV